MKLIDSPIFSRGVCDLCGIETMLPGQLGLLPKATLCITAERRCFTEVQAGRVELPGFGWWKNEWHEFGPEENRTRKLMPTGPWVAENTWVVS